MKKTINFILGVAALFCAVACGSDRGDILKVYNWSDYIGEDVISDFEQWYKEQTGEEKQVTGEDGSVQTETVYSDVDASKLTVTRTMMLSALLTIS